MALIELNLKAKPPNKYAAYMSDNMAVYILEVATVGSKYCVSPPPEDSDIDYLCLIQAHHITNFEDEAKNAGFKVDGTDKGYNNIDFISYRKGDVNLIVMWDRFLFENFKLAADLCKALNLKDKQQRIMVHNVMMNGELKGKKKPKLGGVLPAGMYFAADNPPPLGYAMQKAQAEIAEMNIAAGQVKVVNANKPYQWAVYDDMQPMGLWDNPPFMDNPINPQA